MCKLFNSDSYHFPELKYLNQYNNLYYLCEKLINNQAFVTHGGNFKVLSVYSGNVAFYAHISSRRR